MSVRLTFRTRGLCAPTAVENQRAAAKKRLEQWKRDRETDVQQRHAWGTATLRERLRPLAQQLAVGGPDSERNFLLPADSVALNVAPQRQADSPNLDCSVSSDATASMGLVVLDEAAIEAATDQRRRPADARSRDAGAAPSVWRVKSA